MKAKLLKDRVAKVPLSTCKVCGYSADRATEAKSGLPHCPTPGDVTICLKCGEIYVFDENLMIREPTVDDALKWDPDAFAQVAITQRLIRSRRPLG